MKVLDTDTLTLLFGGHPRVCERHRQEPEEVAITVISQIETLQGRFAMLLKAADGAELRRAQHWLDKTVHDLAAVPRILPVEDAAADQFDELRMNKRLRKIGRADLLIACIGWATGPPW